jgi:hypothetical protein
MLIDFFLNRVPAQDLSVGNRDFQGWPAPVMPLKQTGDRPPLFSEG